MRDCHRGLLVLCPSVLEAGVSELVIEIHMLDPPRNFQEDLRPVDSQRQGMGPGETAGAGCPSAGTLRFLDGLGSCWISGDTGDWVGVFPRFALFGKAH